LVLSSNKPEVSSPRPRDPAEAYCDQSNLKSTVIGKHFSIVVIKTSPKS
jgi:hypothetical protein